MNKFTAGFDHLVHFIGNILVQTFHTLALFAIGAAIVWAATDTYLVMAKTGHFSIEDILLLFIYLELGAMVGIYFKTARLPVRFLVYIAITAITRVMIGMMTVSHKVDMGIVIASGSILILTIATLILRYGSYKMPLNTGLKELEDFAPMPGQPAPKPKQAAATPKPVAPRPPEGSQ